MPLSKLVFKPGINKESTNYANEGGFFSGDKIRFRSGYPEKIGGWTRTTPGRFFLGVCRALVNWRNLANSGLIGIGTQLKYYINRDLGIYHDITPLNKPVQTLGSNPFSTTIGSSIVRVTAAAHLARANDFVAFSDVVGTPITGETYAVTNSGSSAYVFVPGGNNPTLTLFRGATYVFNINSPGHPFFIKTVSSTGTGDQYNVGVTNNGTDNGTITFVVDAGAPDTLFYNCQFHASMAGVLNIVDQPDPNIGGIDVSVFNDSNDGIGFQILDPVISTNQFNIDLGPGNEATSTTTGGGSAVEAAFQLNTGLAASTTGNGFGAGFWNGANVSVSTNLAYTSGATPWVLLNATDTTINAVNTANFPASGTIIINAEVITYSGKTATSFTGCVRGTSQSTAVVHALRPTAGTPAPVVIFNVLGLLGTTGWGEETIGAGVGIALQLRLWTHDNFGQDLVLAVRGGRVYYWENDPTFPRAVELNSDVTIIGTNQVVVSDVSRFVICMGCNSFGDPLDVFDPMLVRWSDQENPTVWTPLATNQSGEQRLSNGSFIMQARKNRQEIVIWTDAAIYSMQYLGPPFVWGFTLLMDNISIISPNAAITVNNVSYWMGIDKFYAYSGRVDTLPCSLRQFVFQDLNYDQRFQIIAGSNEGFNEVWWYYVSNDEVFAATQEQRDPTVDKYIIYNHLEKIWYNGTLSRTFWLDSALQQFPLAAFGTSAQGTLLFHENGVDDSSTETTIPFTAFVQSSDFDIGDGHNFGFVWRMLPDVNFNGSTVNNPSITLTILPRQNSGANYGNAANAGVVSNNNYGVARQYEVQQFTGQVYTRIRGRQMAFRIESTTLGVTWQLGAPRIDVRQDGRR